MNALELLGEELQIQVANAQHLQFPGRREHVLTAGARPAMALACKMELFLQAQPSRVLTMSAVDDVT